MIGFLPRRSVVGLRSKFCTSGDAVNIEGVRYCASRKFVEQFANVLRQIELELANCKTNATRAGASAIIAQWPQG